MTGGPGDRTDRPRGTLGRRGVLAGAAALLAGCSGDPPGSGSPGDLPGPTTSPTAGPDGFGGPRDEDETWVDVRWRDWTPAERRAKRAAAVDVDYETLDGTVDEYVGRTVVFRDAFVQQLLNARPNTDVLGLAIEADGRRFLFASWVGERLFRNDTLDVWGHVLGTETYRTATGATRTVPALSLVDVEVVEPLTPTP